MKRLQRNSVVDFIRRNSVECLNENRRFPFENALFHSDLGTFFSSLDDHELLAKFSFVQPMNLDGILFQLSENDAAQGFGPRKVKLFVDACSYSLGDAETETATQEIELSKSQLVNGEVIDLKQVKFRNVNFVQIYVSENHGSETTRIGKVCIYGEKGDFVDIQKWKPKKDK